MYLAQDFETSLREYLQLGKGARLTPRSEKEGAIVCFTAKVRLESVLDLTTDTVQKALSTDDNELKSPWRFRKKGGVPPTHRLGRAIAAARRFDAVRFKSSKGNGDCFMILTEAIPRSESSALAPVRVPTSWLAASARMTQQCVFKKFCNHIRLLLLEEFDRAGLV